MIRIVKKFESIKTCALLTHISMDGDTLCSCLALKELLVSKGILADVIVEDEIPDNLKFLNPDVISFSAKSSYPVYDLVIALDCASKDRLGERNSIFSSAQSRLVIDHHVSNTGFGDYCYLEPDASSVCEIIFKLYKFMGTNISITAAEYIYTGIVTDTGSFKYSNTTSDTMQCAGELINLGVDNAYICDEALDTKTLAELRIQALAVENTIFFHSGKTALVYITQEMIDKTGAKEGDMSGISSVLRSIVGVTTAAILKDSDNSIKISMRSLGTVDVAKVCSALGGGGHVRAAGATVYDMSAKEIINYLEKKIGAAYGRSD